MVHEILKIKSVHSTVGYSHAAKAGNTLYIAGQVAKDVDDNLVGKGDCEAQCNQAFENLKSILAEAGGTLQNIVKMTTFLTDYSYIEAFRNVRSKYLPEPCPPNTLLIIDSLALPEFMVEIEAIAVLD